MSNAPKKKSPIVTYFLALMKCLLWQGIMQGTGQQREKTWNLYAHEFTFSFYARAFILGGSGLARVPMKL